MLIGNFLSGQLLEYFHWPILFYVFGAISSVFTIAYVSKVVVFVDRANHGSQISR